MTFRIGQKVVFIGRDDRANCYDLIAPDPGAIYTIRAIRTPSSPHDRGPGVLLYEIKNRNHEILDIEYGFLAIYFRPIVERKTDISIFQKMLLPKTEDVKT